MRQHRAMCGVLFYRWALPHRRYILPASGRMRCNVVDNFLNHGYNGLHELHRMLRLQVAPRRGWVRMAEGVVQKIQARPSFCKFSFTYL